MNYRQVNGFPLNSNQPYANPSSLKHSPKVGKDRYNQIDTSTPHTLRQLSSGLRISDLNPLTPEFEEKFTHLPQKEPIVITESPTSTLQRRCMAKIRIKNPSKKSQEADTVYEIQLVGKQHPTQSSRGTLEQNSERQMTGYSNTSIYKGNH